MKLFIELMVLQVCLPGQQHKQCIKVRVSLYKFCLVVNACYEVL